MKPMERKAYQTGVRLAKHVAERLGVERAMERGSLAEYRYYKTSFVKACDKGYMDTLRSM